MRGRAGVFKCVAPCAGRVVAPLLWLKNRNTIQARVATKALNRFMFCVKDSVFSPVVKLVLYTGYRTWLLCRRTVPRGWRARCLVGVVGGAVHGCSDTLSLGIRVQGLGLGASGLETPKAEGVFGLQGLRVVAFKMNTQIH